MDGRYWLFQDFPEPFAYFKVTGEKDNTDFICIDANIAFADMNGVAHSLFKGERVSAIFKHEKKRKEDWMKILDEASKVDESKRFKHYFFSSEAVFEVTAYGDGDKQFAVLLHDVTASESEKSGLNTLLTSLQEYLKLPAESLDYQTLTDKFLKLSGAKFAVLNTYERQGTKTITRAISGPGEGIRRAMKVLGFDLFGKEWDILEERVESIKRNSILHYDSLYEAAFGTVSKRTAFMLEKTFNLGDNYVLQVTEDTDIIGDFIFFMPKNKSLKNPEIVQIYANQVGIMILRKRSAEKIHYLSYHDALTGLYNRAYLEGAMESPDQAYVHPVSVIMADINGLKLINDIYGHYTGDALLKSFVRILKEHCDEQAIIGRWGGDEFIIILEATAENKARALAERIKQTSEATTIEVFPISASFGTSVKRKPDQPFNKAIKEAEGAMYKEKFSSSAQTKQAHIDALFDALKAKSHETDAHIETMWAYAQRLAFRANMTEHEMNQLRVAISWHDLGKVSIPKQTLVKPSRLTEEEWNIMKEHPETGYRIAMTTQQNVQVALYIRAHHEHYDGSGYPHGLKGKEIPRNARVIAIVDAYEVMRSGRPYKNVLSQEEIIDEFKRNQGTQFDPELVRLFLEILNEDLEEAHNHT